MAESEAGKGTTFKLSIPISKKAKPKNLPPEPIPKTTFKKLRILVIDDEERICVMLNEFLSRSGHMVKTVDNGAYVIGIAGKEEFDLVLCDLAMPDVNGYDVIKVLNQTGQRTKVGIITGWGKKLSLIEDENLKVDFVIRKPFNLSELEKQINGLFSDCPTTSSVC